MSVTPSLGVPNPNLQTEMHMIHQRGHPNWSQSNHFLCVGEKGICNVSGVSLSAVTNGEMKGFSREVCVSVVLLLLY